MVSGEGACLICGKPLLYTETAKTIPCSICQKTFSANAVCEDGHYVCDHCHQKQGVDRIIAYCAESDLRDPIRMLREMMEDPYVHMHGPEHHVMVGAALITAYHNSGGEVDRAAALEQMRLRGSQCPGGTCGFWGCCGAAVSAGIYLSIVTGTTPLSGESWGWVNEMTSRVLAALAKTGGPRCCKRNSFTAARVAAQYTKELLGVELVLPTQIRCDFSGENAQCLHEKCPYYGK